MTATDCTSVRNERPARRFFWTLTELRECYQIASCSDRCHTRFHDQEDDTREVEAEWRKILEGLTADIPRLRHDLLVLAPDVGFSIPVEWRAVRWKFNVHREEIEWRAVRREADVLREENCKSAKVEAFGADAAELWRIVGEMDLMLEAARAAEERENAAWSEEAESSNETSDKDVGGKTQGTEQVHVLDDIQRKVLESLAGTVLRVEVLAGMASGGDTSRLYKGDRLKQLTELGLVAKCTSGYYRPDSPPPNAVVTTVEPTKTGKSNKKATRKKVAKK